MVVIKGESPLKIVVYQGNSTSSAKYATLECPGVGCDTAQPAHVNGQSVNPTTQDDFEVELAPGAGAP